MEMKMRLLIRLLVFGALAVLVLVAVALLWMRTRAGELRGRQEPSPDGKTYLALMDDNGGQACRYPKVDGKPWPHAWKTQGAIAPGTHTIECGGSVAIEVRAGNTFYFDYWGP